VTPTLRSLHVAHDPWLLLLGIAIAVLAAYSLLGTAERALTIRGRIASAWYIGGAISLGFGIWSMHFLSMQALHLPFDLHFNALWSLLSIVPASLGSGAVLWASAQPLTRRRLAVAAVGFGVGVGAMHYLGVAAIEVVPSVSYDPVWVLVSVVVAVLVAAIAIVSASRCVTARGGWRSRLSASAVIGVGVAITHHVAMNATYFPVQAMGSWDLGKMSSSGMSLAVSLVSLIVLGCTVLVSWFDASRRTVAHPGRNEMATLRVLSIGIAMVGLAGTTAGYLWLRRLGSGGGSAAASQVVADASVANVFAVGGASISFLLAFCAWVMLADRTAVRVRLANLAQQHERLAKVAQYTSNIVVITDANRRMVWANDGYTRLTGYTLEESLGKSPGAILQCELTDPTTVHALRTALNNGDSFKGEIFNRSKAGRDYWLEIDVQPVTDAHGAITGFVAIESDITERKHAQQQLETALRDSEVLLDTLRSHFKVSVSDASGRILEVNDNFVRMSGYTRAELIGNSHTLLNSGHHPPEFWANMWTTITRGEPWRGEVRNRAKDGTVFWVDSVIAPFVGPDGTIEKLIGIARDITVSVEANQALASSRERLASILDGANVGTWEWDMPTDEIEIDARFAALLGYELDELRPYNRARAESLMHPDDVLSTLIATEQVIDGEEEQLSVEVRMRHRDGDWRWIASRGRVIAYSPEGRPTRISGIHADVTGRRNAEAEREKSNALLKSVLDAASEISVIATDINHTVTVFNVGAERLLGYTSAEVVNANSPFQFHLVEEIASRAEELSQKTGRTIVGGEAFIDPSVLGVAHEWTYVHKNGKHIPVSLVITARYDEHGQVIGYLGVARDITEAREFEQTLRAATTEAQAASAAKGQFLANMSHEIRTPMNAILGMLSLLQNTELNTRQLDYATKTEGAARSLLRLLNDILDYSKVEAGKMTLDPHPFRIDKMFRELAVIMSANVGQKEVEVLFDIDAQLPDTVIGDATRLQQVLINLGGNAIKFTDRGEVVVKVAVLSTSESEVTLDFSVRDSGIGIAPENQAKIFEGFSQAEPSTTRRFGGTGLGLSICLRLVELMGGALRLHSVEGQGSTFAFTLTVPIAASLADVVPAAMPRTPLRVLIVDDNPTACQFHGAMIESLGWQSIVANSGAEALRLIEAAEHPFEAVFVDWQMASMDGWETCRRIRASRTNGIAPVVIMVTAYGREMLAQRSESDQALINGFLVKPVTASMLFDVIADARSTLAHPPRRARADSVDQKRLLGIRILVVEDNAINQQVAQELLEDEGATITIAGNGREGVDALAGAPDGYDIVLMDLQMPVMDGIAATSEIRETLGMRTLPIVAMTANAMASDRELCIQAGMNDHVGKPFDIDQLAALIVALVPKRATGTVPPTPLLVSDSARPIDAKRGHLPESLPPFDLPVALRRLQGKDQFLRTLLIDFHRKYADSMTQMRALLDGNALADAERLAHTIKGMAATLEARSLRDACDVVERALREHRAHDVAGLLPALDTELHAALAACATLSVSQPQTQVPVAYPSRAVTDADRKAMSVLESALTTRSLRARAHATELQELLSGLGVEQSARELVERVHALDFPAAQRSLLALRDAIALQAAA